MPFENDGIYIIGEIGINHNGDLQVAKRLIDACFACQWNCVKFQKRNPDKCIPKNQKQKIKVTPWGKMTYLEYKHKIEFGRKEYDYIDRYCREKPIDWTVSVWDDDSLDFIKRYDVPFVKIPSAMFTNSKLLKKAVGTGKRLVVSTGMVTESEVYNRIEELYEYLYEFYGGKSVKDPVIMHCNSSYPSPKEEINLNFIKKLKEKYPDCIIGYSGHEQDLEPSVVAVALGADVIERHITISHDMWGTDHKASLEVVGMDILRKRVKDVRKIMGNGIKIITKSELLVMDKLKGII